MVPIVSSTGDFPDLAVARQNHKNQRLSGEAQANTIGGVSIHSTAHDAVVGTGGTDNAGATSDGVVRHRFVASITAPHEAALGDSQMMDSLRREFGVHGLGDDHIEDMLVRPFVCLFACFRLEMMDPSPSSTSH